MPAQSSPTDSRTAYYTVFLKKSTKFQWYFTLTEGKQQEFIYCNQFILVSNTGKNMTHFVEVRKMVNKHDQRNTQSITCL